MPHVPVWSHSVGCRALLHGAEDVYVRIPVKAMCLLIRLNELLIHLNELLIRLNELIIRLNKLIIRWNELIIRLNI